VPFLSFDSIAKRPSRCASVVPAVEFDRRNLTSFAFYSPDMCHEGHDVGGTGFDRVKSTLRSVPGARYLGIVPPKLAQTASWLQRIPRADSRRSPGQEGHARRRTFDESLSEDNNHIHTVFLGDMVRPGARIDRCHDHYDLLRTVEENFGLGTLGREDERSGPHRRGRLA
jgi:hypothetical protein